MKKYFCNDKITIGVASHGNLEITKKCIDSIINSIDGNFEIILVDDCSPDDGAIKNYFVNLKKDFQDIKVFYFSKNLGYVNSVNCILSNSTGNKIIFISNDIIINPYYLEEVINISNISDDIGCVRGVSNFVSGGLKPHNIDMKEYSNTDPIDIAKDILLKNKNNYSEEEYLTGDCFLINRKLIDVVGYFDCTKFYNYFGDVDFGTRARAFNFKLIVSKGAFCIHHKDINFNYLPQEEKIRKINRRRYQLVEDWARFKINYNLPNDLPYTSINNIDFNKLQNQFNKKKEIKKKEYSEYLVL